MEMLLSVAGAFGGLELLKWLFSLKTSRKKADAEIADNLEDVISKRMKGYEDTVNFMQTQLREKDEQIKELSEKYQESLSRTIDLTKKHGEMKLKYQQTRCDRKSCADRKPPFKWMKKTVAALAFLLMFFACSCSRKVYVPVETVKIRMDSVEKIRHQIDSIVVRDSVIMLVRGDTTIKEVWRWREKIVLKRDTLFILKRDTIKEPRVVDMHSQDSKTSKNRNLQIGMWIALVVVGVLIGARLWSRRS